MTVNSDFLKFCQSGATRDVLRAIRQGADVNERDENGNTALIFAASKRPRVVIIRALLEGGADATARNNDGATALIFAAAKTMRPDVITLMLNAGADANVELANGWTALMFAAAENPDPEVVKALWCGRARINHRAEDGTTALMLAAERNPNADVVKELIKYGAHVNAKDNGGRTALIAAALRNSRLVSEPDPNPEAIDALLDGGADVNAVWEGDKAIDMVKDSPYLQGTDTLTRLETLSGDSPILIGASSLLREESAKSLDDTLTQEQVGRLLGGIDRSHVIGLRDYALLSLIVSCGLSYAEASRIRIRDIDTDGGEAFLNVGGGRVRIPARVMDALREYWEARGESEPDAPSFTGLRTHKNQPMSAKAIGERARRAAQGLGADGERFRPGTLKHTAVKLALQSGRRIEDVKKFARHRYIGTTYHYSVLSRKTGHTCGDTIASALF